MFEKNLILVKQMLEVIDRIFDYTKNCKNTDDFASDSKTFDATLMNFILLGESVGKLSLDFRNQCSQINWKKIYGFRNIIAHNYFGVDEEEVWEIIKKHLPKLKKDLCKIL